MVVVGGLPAAGVVVPALQGGVQGREVRIAKRMHKTSQVTDTSDTPVAVYVEQRLQCRCHVDVMYVSCAIGGRVE